MTTPNDPGPIGTSRSGWIDPRLKPTTGDSLTGSERWPVPLRPDGSFDVQGWAAKVEADSRAKRAERRRAYFDGHDTIPDLVFEAPECSVCGAQTGYDGDAFWCEECGISWPRNGYGHEATRDADLSQRAIR